MMRISILLSAENFFVGKKNAESRCYLKGQQYLESVNLGVKIVEVHPGFCCLIKGDGNY